MDDRIRLLGIAPYEEMRTLMQEMAEAHEGIDLTAFVGDLQQGVELARHNFYNDYDAIISRGGTASLLREGLDLPVIEIPISSCDILRAMRLAEGVGGRCAVVGFPNVANSARELGQVLGRTVDIYPIRDAGEAEAVSRLGPGFVEALRREGVTAFVDRAGRRWSLHTYGSMVLRTTTRQAEVLSVLTRDPEGLCHPCEREDGFYIDAWQRAIVMNAGSRRGEEGDWPGGDEEKRYALRFVVTGDLNTCEIRVASLGQYDSPIPLLEAHPEPLGIQIQNQNWMIGNHLQESGQTHSVVLMPDEKGRVRLFDPWDGFSEVYTPAQLFRSGFLSSLGRGVIKWIQYIE